MSSKANILLFGTGSIGAVYLYQLQQSGCTVTAICRSNYSAVKEHGFRMNSVRYGNVTYRPDAIVQDISEIQSHEKFDFILVCAKSFPNSKPSLANILRPILERDASTSVVLAQNGIMIEEEIATSFPENPLLSGVIYCPAYQTAPGIIEYPEMLNLLELGTYPANAPSHHQAAAHRFAALMRLGGGGAEVHEDIQISRWIKIAMNAAWSPICALTMCTDGFFLTTSDPYAYQLAWGIMAEVVSLAQKLGYTQVTEEVARQKLTIATKRAELGTGREPSMLQDVRQSRPLEVEAILGNTLRVANEQGMALPRLETMYALVKARSAALVKDKKVVALKDDMRVEMNGVNGVSS